ncbi:MAG: putative quinol monooxygenase [Thermodesulfobacteriota bacterium]
MMILTAVFRAQPGKDKALEEVLKAMFPYVQKEPGVVTYNLQKSEKSPGTFLFYERYKDKQAFEAHGSTPHFQDLNKNLEGLLVEPPIVEFYSEIGSIERGQRE